MVIEPSCIEGTFSHYMGKWIGSELVHRAGMQKVSDLDSLALVYIEDELVGVYLVDTCWEQDSFVYLVPWFEL